MKKILSLVLVAMLSLSFAAPVSTGRGPGGGFPKASQPGSDGCRGEVPCK